MRSIEYLRAYEGQRATEYEAKRKNTPAWLAEQNALELFLCEANLPPGSTILDIPVGTGRFLETYARHGYRVIGLDISEDMLNTARDRCTALDLKNAVLDIGDALAIKLADKSIDITVCVRFLIHMELKCIRYILSELARVSSRYIIIHVRICRPSRDLTLRQKLGKIRQWLRSSLRSFAFQKGRNKAAKMKILKKSATIHSAKVFRNILSEQRLRIVHEQLVNSTHQHESRMYLLAL